jgi:hypothetical protein
MRTAITLVSFLAFCLKLMAQAPDVIQHYIETYRDIAIEEMHRTGVPASIKLAQGIHETTAGTSDLVIRSNNHFGIKCKSNWTGESVSHDDDAPQECFRKYDDPFQSYRDHSDFLRGSNRYASLFTLDPLNYQAWAYGLKRAGYATNPRYPQILIKLIETYQLQDYTMIALGKMPPKENMIAKAGDESSTGNGNAITHGPDASDLDVPTASYPSGEFKINDTRVIFATAGTSMLSIARQYDVPLARIFEFNDMQETEELAKDQLIFLQRKRKTGQTEFHIVKKGENLRDISQLEAIRMESLLELNHLQSYMQPAAGEQLFLRKKAPAMPKLARNDVATAGGATTR